MNITNRRTRKRIERGLRFLEAVQKIGVTPLSSRDLDKHLSSGTCPTGAYLRTCLKRVVSPRRRIGCTAEYEVIPEKMAEVRQALETTATQPPPTTRAIQH